MAVVLLCSHYHATTLKESSASVDLMSLTHIDLNFELCQIQTTGPGPGSEQCFYAVFLHFFLT